MNKKKNETIVFDIGSSKIASMIGITNNLGEKKEVEILNHFLYPCEGIKSSLVTNFPQAEESIINTVIAVEKASKHFIKEVAISICTSRAISTYVTAKIKIAGQGVTKQDLHRLITKALADFGSGQVIHYFPVEFILDNNHGIVNPIDLLGSELSCNLHIVSVESNLFNNLVHCLSKCQIKVKDIVLSGYASALGCTSPNTEQTGTLVIDFGARTTAFVVLFERRMIYCGHVPMGSWYITSDIARAFSISMNSAEKLKILHGSGKISHNPHLINLYDIDSTEFNPSQVMSTTDLSSVINARVEEIFTLLKEEYNKLKINELVAQNITITGNGSNLSDLAEIVAEIFGKSVKIGHSVMSDTEGNGGGYVGAVGMLNFIADKYRENQDTLNNLDNKGKMLSKMWGWLKNNV